MFRFWLAILVVMGLIDSTLADSFGCHSDKDCENSFIGKKCAYYSGSSESGSDSGSHVRGSSCLPQNFCGQRLEITVGGRKVLAGIDCDFLRWFWMGGYWLFVGLGLILIPVAVTCLCCRKRRRRYILF